ncbi:collagen alpha-1(I) chain-like [Choloepus didactylus]|uniref:collagen alpha-1(I) chain-like n=1 Tax=Choloepus didactylus TaxID=27675 RepID=UPI0018A029F0|nr:collagen alpha-1(I) chain-like [Choloepus didactylus]
MARAPLAAPGQLPCWGKRKDPGAGRGRWGEPRLGVSAQHPAGGPAAAQTIAQAEPPRPVHSSRAGAGPRPGSPASRGPFVAPEGRQEVGAVGGARRGPPPLPRPGSSSRSAPAVGTGRGEEGGATGAPPGTRPRRPPRAPGADPPSQPGGGVPGGPGLDAPAGWGSRGPSPPAPGSGTRSPGTCSPPNQRPPPSAGRGRPLPQLRGFERKQSGGAGSVAEPGLRTPPAGPGPTREGGRVGSPSPPAARTRGRGRTPRRAPRTRPRGGAPSPRPSQRRGSGGSGGAQAGRPPLVPSPSCRWGCRGAPGRGGPAWIAGLAFLPGGTGGRGGGEPRAARGPGGDAGREGVPAPHRARTPSPDPAAAPRRAHPRKAARGGWRSGPSRGQLSPPLSRPHPEIPARRARGGPGPSPGTKRRPPRPAAPAPLTNPVRSGPWAPPAPAPPPPALGPGSALRPGLGLPAPPLRLCLRGLRRSPPPPLTSGGDGGVERGRGGTHRPAQEGLRPAATRRPGLGSRGLRHGAGRRGGERSRASPRGPRTHPVFPKCPPKAFRGPGGCAWGRKGGRGLPKLGLRGRERASHLGVQRSGDARWGNRGFSSRNQSGWNGPRPPGRPPAKSPEPARPFVVAVQGRAGRPSGRTTPTAGGDSRSPRRLDNKWPSPDVQAQGAEGNRAPAPPASAHSLSEKPLVAPAPWAVLEWPVSCQAGPQSRAGCASSSGQALELGPGVPAEKPVAPHPDLTPSHGAPHSVLTPHLSQRQPSAGRPAQGADWGPLITLQVAEDGAHVPTLISGSEAELTPLRPRGASAKGAGGAARDRNQNSPSGCLCSVRTRLGVFHLSLSSGPEAEAFCGDPALSSVHLGAE